MQIALWGLRGGVGTTSVTAMLADVLGRASDSVLVVDMNPADMLRLHFGVSYGDERGWANAGQTPFWHQQTVQVTDSLTVLPYGYHRTAGVCHAKVATAGDVFWADYYPVLTQMYHWVLFDMPPGSDCYPRLRRASDLRIVVTGVDMASYILLEQAVFPPDTRVLVNGLDPAHRLSNDILLAWRQRQHGAELLPALVRHDQNIHEAFAHKAPATSWMAGSSAAHDMAQVAQWCQAQYRTGRRDGHAARCEGVA